MVISQHKPTLLIVDDTPANIDVLRALLQNDYKIKAATSGLKAIEIAQTSPYPDLILLDIMMPEMDGYETCRRLKETAYSADIPVIFITAKNQEEDETLGFSVGAVDYITKPIRPDITKVRIKTHLKLHNQAKLLEDLVIERTNEVTHTRQQLINRLSRAAEFKDNETGLHVYRMSQFARILAEAYQQDESYADLICQSAPMHDIGKIGIPDAVLLKPGKLTTEEWEVMKRHPEFGARIIGKHNSLLLQTAHEIALSHHEKWDGSGYPRQLEGDKIPKSARIVAIADVYDALTSERPYKKAWSTQEATNFIMSNAGTHFDPTLVKLLPDVLPKFEEIQIAYSDRPQADTPQGWENF